MALWRRRSRVKRRKGVAGILAALLLFVMLFTVGTGYFISVNQSNLLYTQTLSNRANDLQSTLGESLVLLTGLASGNGDITVTVTNIGSQPTTLVQLFMVNPSGSVTPLGPAMTPPLPLSLNPGATSAAIDTTVVYGSGTYTLNMLTQRGAEFSQTYPPTAVPLAQLAITTQGAGFLSLNFNSYAYYTCPVSPCAVGNQLSPWSAGNPAYNFAASLASKVAFAVTVTNVDPQKRTVTLYQQTRLVQLIYPSSGSSFKDNYWSIGNVNSTGTITGQLGTFSQISITYGQTLTLYFTALANTQASSLPGSGDFVQVFILLYGTIGSGAYGQNIPFVTTLYN